MTHSQVRAAAQRDLARLEVKTSRHFMKLIKGKYQVQLQARKLCCKGKGWSPAGSISVIRQTS